VGQGTTFKLYLPAAERQALPEEKDVEEKLPRGGGETILLVDDEESIRTFASAALRRFGYQVLTGASGEEALEVIGRTKDEIALVILDLGMPGMGGHKCLQEIRKIDAAARVLIASGYSMNGQVKKSLEMGAAGYVGKPYRINVLLRKVREILDGEE
jgi:DNA-binding response OmpR family regulator